MNNNFPLVSIVIPVRNEEGYIASCLENIIRQEYPPDKMEILVADGKSTDQTTDIIRSYISKYPQIRLLVNEHQTVPYALNLAIRESKGDIIIRLDAHSGYPVNYVPVLVHSLEVFNADNVGSAWITLPGADTVSARSIAAALSNKLGIGNAEYRLGTTGPKQVDTVPYGCYRRDVFDRIGLFDEQLTRNQDDEFNARLIKHGGKIVLIPDIQIKYYARKDISSLSKMYYQYGYFKPLVNIKIGSITSIRQLFPPAFVSGLVIFVLLSFFFKLFAFLSLLISFFYLTIVFIVSLSLQRKTMGTGLWNLVRIFPAIHFSYGCGYLKGIWDFLVLRKHSNRKKIDVSFNR